MECVLQDDFFFRTHILRTFGYLCSVKKHLQYLIVGPERKKGIKAETDKQLEKCEKFDVWRFRRAFRREAIHTIVRSV